MQKFFPPFIHKEKTWWSHPESVVKNQIACVVKIVLCRLRHGRKPRSMSSLLHCLLFFFFVTSFLTIILFSEYLFISIVYFSTKRNTLFSLTRMGTQHLLFYGQKIFVCALCLFKSLLWVLIFCDFKKQNNFVHSSVSKESFCMIPSCSPVFLWTLFYSTFFSSIYFLNSLKKTCHSFLFISCFFFLCFFVFLSSLFRLFPFVCCLHTYLFFLDLFFFVSVFLVVSLWFCSPFFLYFLLSLFATTPIFLYLLHFSLSPFFSLLPFFLYRLLSPSPIFGISVVFSISVLLCSSFPPPPFSFLFCLYPFPFSFSPFTMKVPSISLSGKSSCSFLF